MIGKVQTLEEIQIVRSSRKTVSLTVKPDGSVEVRAPEKMRMKQIRDFIEEHREWIREKQELVEEHRNRRKTFAKRFVNGEKFLYLGREHMLDLVGVPDRKCTGVEVIADTLTVEVGTLQTDTIQERAVHGIQEAAETAIRKWYKEEARKCFEERTAFFAERMGEAYGQIRMKEQKTRWGSCSSRGNLNFNWKLIMAPPEILDYVVVHELCHLREMNHSKRFWQAVEEVLPDYRVYRHWLKMHGEELCLDRSEELQTT